MPASANTSRDVLRPPIDASSFDYVYQVEDVSVLRQRWSDDPAFIPTVVVYGVAFVFGFLGNLFVALALIVDRRQRAVLAAADGGGSHHLTTSFLVSLSMADVLFLLVCLPYELVVKLESVWRGGLAICKLAGFVEMITATASVLNLSAVSIERFDLLRVFVENTRKPCCRKENTRCRSCSFRFSEADRDPQNIWGPHKDCGFFVDATSSEP